MRLLTIAAMIALLFSSFAYGQSPINTEGFYMQQDVLLADEEPTIDIDKLPIPDTL